MKNVTDSFVSLGHWPSAGSFGFNTDILATNSILLELEEYSLTVEWNKGFERGKGFAGTSALRVRFRWELLSLKKGLSPGYQARLACWERGSFRTTFGSQIASELYKKPFRLRLVR
ncbi:ATP synthase subunit b, chloroplastic, partial [Sesamum alatum]